VPPRTAEYHLRYLARLKLLREHAVEGGPRRFAPPTAAAPPAVASLDAQILALLREKPGISTREMGAALGVGYGRLDRAMKELLCAGRVESRVDAGRRAYYPSGPAG
jgi:predicted transcriptional regulator